MFIEKIRFITNLILTIRIKFFDPKKNRILIFDKELSRINCKILNLKAYGVLHTRKEEICLPIIIKLLISFKLNSLNYYIEYIKHSGAKIIITFIDNNFDDLSSNMENTDDIGILNSVDYENYSVKELKDIIYKINEEQNKKISISGNKTTLIERIVQNL